MRVEEKVDLIERKLSISAIFKPFQGNNQYMQL